MSFEQTAAMKRQASSLSHAPDEDANSSLLSSMNEKSRSMNDAREKHRMAHLESLNASAGVSQFDPAVDGAAEKIGLNESFASAKLDLNALEEVLKEKGVLLELKRSLNLIAVPLLILAVIGIGFLLVWAEDILVPFVISIFFNYLLRPIVDFLSRPLGTCHQVKMPKACLRRRARSGEPTVAAASDSPELPALESIELVTLLGEERKSSDDDDNNGKSKRMVTRKFDECLHAKCPRWLSVVFAMLIVFAALIGLVVFVIDVLQQFEKNSLQNYEDRLVELAQYVLEWLRQNFNIEGSYMLSQMQSEFKLVQVTKSLIYTMMNAVAYTFLVFLFTLYMLFEEGNEHSLSSRRINRSHSYAADLRRQIDSQIQSYIVIKTVISALVGILVYIVLGPILNVKLAHLFGVITFVANYIPNVGAIVATLVPLPVVILDTEQTALSRILAIALPVLIHTIVGNFVEPKVFGDTMELHPVIVVLSLSLWYTIWGIPGAILSVPITAVGRIIVSNISHPYANVILRILEGKLPGSAEFHS